jgi:hypothetical protein
VAGRRRRFIRIQLFAVFNDTIEGPRAPAVDSGSESLARRMSAESEWTMIGTPWLGVVSTRETYSAGFPKPCQRVSKAHSKELAKSSAEFLSPGTTLYLASLALMDLLTSRRLVSDGFRGLPDSLGSPGLPGVCISRSLFFCFLWSCEESHGTPAAVSAPS